MSVRNFAAANDEIRCAVGGTDPSGAMTEAALVKRNATGSFQSVMASHTSGNVYRTEFGFYGAGTHLNKLIWFDNVRGVGSVSGTTTITSTTVWHLIVYTRPTSSGFGRFHIFPFGGAWTHVAGIVESTGTLLNVPTMGAGGFWDFGEAQDLDDYNGRLAVAGVWNAELSDADCEALATNLRTTDWTTHSTAPLSVWEFNQVSTATAVVDLVGTSTETVRNGTTVVTTDDPPGWTFTGAVTETPAPNLVMAPYQGAF